MRLPTANNKILDALLIPVRLLILIYRDIRCHWFNRHTWYHSCRLLFSDTSSMPSAWQYEDVCTNFYCRRVRPGSTSYLRWRPEHGWGGRPKGVADDGQD